MQTKFLALTAGAALLGFSGLASAQCTTAAWLGGAAGGVQAVQFDPNATPLPLGRYGGRCLLNTTAVGQFVTDNTPDASTSSYRARFYFYSGNLATTGTNEVDIFRARDAANTTSFIRVTWSTSPSPRIRFYVNGTTTTADVTTLTRVGGTETINLAANRWYSVEVRWAAGSPSTFTGIVGGSLSAPVTGLPNTFQEARAQVTISGISNSADRVRLAQLGQVAGTGTGRAFFDEFDSRRTTDIGRLCRGDANGDGIIGAADRVLVTNEIAGSGTQPTGQPDANEDGIVTPADRVTITNTIAGALACN